MELFFPYNYRINRLEYHCMFFLLWYISPIRSIEILDPILNIQAMRLCDDLELIRLQTSNNLGVPVNCTIS